MGVFLETYKIMCNFALFNHFSYNSGLKDRFRLNPIWVKNYNYGMREL